MTRVLGIDGGGTKTLAAILDERGRLLGVGRGGPSNYDDVGVERAGAHLHQAVDAARRRAGIGDEPFAHAFLGLAGVASARDEHIICEIATALGFAPQPRIDVDHDARIALAGGLTGRPGVVIIAGTGSSCYGRNADDAGWLAGAWGPLLADEGSSYWLGLRALQQAASAYDGRGPATVLEARVCDRLGVAEVPELMHRLYVDGVTRAEMAALAPLVTAAAVQGDAVARDLLAEGAAGLVNGVVAVARRLRMADGPLEVALVGGLFEAGAVVLDPLHAALADRLPQAKLVAAELPPVLGAGLLALRGAGVALDEGVIRALRDGAAQLAHDPVTP